MSIRNPQMEPGGIRGYALAIGIALMIFTLVGLIVKMLHCLFLAQ